MKQSLAEAILKKRIRERPSPNLIDIHTNLHHFALINYALPKERLIPHIPTDRFDIPEFEINGQKLAMMSAVPFWDSDFNYVRIAPWLKGQFAQTNYRVYVIDKATNEHVVWFFGTTLGSPIVYGARWLWGIPWHYAQYNVDCLWQNGRYTNYNINSQSNWAASDVQLEDTGEPITVQKGFDSLTEMELILTHPVQGYYWRLNGRLGSYSIWHDKIPLTTAKSKNLYFSLYEKLDLLTPTEMQHPHSIFLCPQTHFDVHLPPKKL